MECPDTRYLVEGWNPQVGARDTVQSQVGDTSERLFTCVGRGLVESRSLGKARVRVIATGVSGARSGGSSPRAMLKEARDKLDPC